MVESALVMAGWPSVDEPEEVTVHLSISFLNHPLHLYLVQQKVGCIHIEVRPPMPVKATCNISAHGSTTLDL